jgi:hypothetical protein
VLVSWLFLVAAAFFTLLFAVLGLKIAYLEWRSRWSRSRGFEVKLTSGEAPEMQRKDNDHG